MLRISKYTWLTLFYLYCHELKKKESERERGGGEIIQQNVATRHKFRAPENFKV